MTRAPRPTASRSAARTGCAPRAPEPLDALLVEATMTTCGLGRSVRARPARGRAAGGPAVPSSARPRARRITRRTRRRRQPTSAAGAARSTFRRTGCFRHLFFSFACPGAHDSARPAGRRASGAFRRSATCRGLRWSRGPTCRVQTVTNFSALARTPGSSPAVRRPRCARTPGTGRSSSRRGLCPGHRVEGELVSRACTSSVRAA